MLEFRDGNHFSVKPTLLGDSFGRCGSTQRHGEGMFTPIYGPASLRPGMRRKRPSLPISGRSPGLSESDRMSDTSKLNCRLYDARGGQGLGGRGKHPGLQAGVSRAQGVTSCPPPTNAGGYAHHHHGGAHTGGRPCWGRSRFPEGGFMLGLL